jgi:hypothetical protein
MNIDIDHLDLESLCALNDRVIERIKFLEHARAHLSMIAFNIGAHVSFETATGRQFGRLVKNNQKTVNVDTEEGRRWRISPHLLSQVKEVLPVKPPAQRLTQNQKKKRKKNASAITA